MRNVAFVSSARFVDHDTGPTHPERPDRIRAIHRAVRLAGLVTSSDPFPEFKLDVNVTRAERSVTEIEAVPVEDDTPLLVHTPSYLEQVRRGCARSAVLDLSDTPTCPASFATALRSLGSAIQAADFVMTGPQGSRAFSAARPPGHHAEVMRPMGFCLFNNIAIAARHIERRYELERIAIVDFDVHHGNGTQDAFEDDPRVLFISIHQHPSTLYPGTGHDHEVGHSAGRGYTLNVPMNPASGDEAYARAFDQKIVPALDRFRPQMLLISAGFDAHADDPLAHIELSDDGFAMMTGKLCAVADTHCQGRVVSLLEGGYNLAALGRSVVRHVIELAR